MGVAGGGSSAAAGSVWLVDRAAEQVLIAERLDDRQSGAAIVLRGPAGVGKSALVEDAVRRAGSSRRVLRTVGTWPETGLAMAGLYQLLQPLFPLAPQIPGPRQGALRVAFGISAGPPPEPFAVAMAALELLAEAAARQPLLVIAEDVHLLDAATVGVLRFIARRLLHDPIVLLATARDEGPDPLGGTATRLLDLEPLSADGSRQLLESVAPDLTGSVRAGILRVAEGNPLALVELPKTPGLTLRPTMGSQWLPLTQRLLAAFAARVERLPATTQTALTLLALNDAESLPEVLQALGTEGAPAPVAVVEPAVEAALVQLSGTELRFRHGLMRSAVYRLASPSSRVAGHLALARAVGAGTDRGILHRARATEGYDEELAADLDLIAERALARGAVSTAVTTLARAADLTGATELKRRYLFRAAALAYELGERNVGDAHSAVLALLADDEHSRLLLEELSDAADAGASGGGARIQSLIGLAERARQLGDERLAGSFLRSAAFRCWQRQPEGDLSRRVVELVTAAAGSLTDPQRAVMLAYADPVGSASVVTGILHGVVTTDLDSVTVQTLGHAAACIGDFELADVLFTDAAARLRAEGRLQVLARAICLQAWARLRRGQWSTAMPLAEEGTRLAEESGQAEYEGSGLAAQAMVAALRGNTVEAASAADRAERIAFPGQMTIVLAISLLARATAAAGEGDFSAAWEYLSRLHQTADPACHPPQAVWSLSHLAYAAVQCDRVAQTQKMVARLRSRLQAEAVVPAVRMNLVYADALLAPGEFIEDRVRTALDTDVGSWPFERSRMQLLLGSQLRRRRRIAQARELLRAAQAGFDNLGAAQWAERARKELRAAGVASSAQAPALWNSLSPQELQVARMVAEGLSNRQIAERLYLSHRTVASHLYRIFPKLGITSRAQLAVMSLDLPASPES
ncbi:MAG TPA: LuxR C-terminal-related transcriptional regulator [Streptosporangiaceae bacterium]|nr:LuxR C-terminal-related transcriptional regulator [Streptosporangiaceae bacterium]